MTWREEVKRTDLRLAKDYAIVGWGQSTSSLRNMVRALKMMRLTNTAEQEARLAAAQRILRKSGRRKNPRRRRSRRNSKLWSASKVSSRLRRPSHKRLTALIKNLKRKTKRNMASGHSKPKKTAQQQRKQLRKTGTKQQRGEKRYDRSIRGLAEGMQ